MASARATANKKAAANPPDRQKKTNVSKKRFKDASGKYTQVTVLDANAATFGTDLLNVFKANVAKARKENKRLFGSPDGIANDKMTGREFGSLPVQTGLEKPAPMTTLISRISAALSGS